jgi:hypothetical protein
MVGSWAGCWLFPVSPVFSQEVVVCYKLSFETIGVKQCF